jgi:cobalt-precorrin-7 (C5)-methyltransferase
MKIVGVGCGPGLVTREAASVIRTASLIVGSDRAIDLVRDLIPQDCIVQTITDYRALRALPEEAVLLSTGDPMMSGLGYLPGTVIPGISSVQLGAARLHIPLTRLMVLTAHGRNHKAIMEQTRSEIGHGKNVCLITDPGFDIKDLAAHLSDTPDTGLVICQDLGYPAEQILRGSVRIPPIPATGLYILFVISSEKNPA